MAHGSRTASGHSRQSKVQVLDEARGVRRQQQRGGGGMRGRLALPRLQATTAAYTQLPSQNPTRTLEAMASAAAEYRAPSLLDVPFAWGRIAGHPRPGGRDSRA